jgi:hypothetical protein
MSLLTGFSFASPWLLLGLGVLPLVWFLLRVTPPRPKRVVFPPVKLLAGLHDKEETPAGTPWWLMALRLVAAASLIVALSGPQLGRSLELAEAPGGPLLLFVDNGWTAAHNWEARKSLAREALRLAQVQKRPVAVIATADRFDTDLLDSGDAMRVVEALRPQPWLAGRERALKAVAAMKLKGGEVLWLSDGLDDGLAGKAAEALRACGRLTVYRDSPEETPLALTEVESAADGFEITVLRAGVHGQRFGTLAALGVQDEVMGSGRVSFARGQNRVHIHMSMPLEMRNRTQRLVLEGEKSAAGTFLLDRGAPRHAIGIVANRDSDEEPLLSGSYYLERALRPFADAIEGTVSSVLERRVSVLILADIGKLAGSDRDAVAKFVDEGGLLIRFAGDRLTEGGDELTPVRLRSGGRSLGGMLTWTTPQHLVAFAPNSPFAGLDIPPDVTVSRQILAEPSIELTEHTWARLTDGTPMVTAARRGKGWIVLFHVTASPSWSSLPLSGLYVEMLRRLLPLSAGTNPGEPALSATLSPSLVLDGFGRLRRAGADIRPVAAAALKTTEPSSRHPPGLYGPAGAERALNAGREDTALLPMGHFRATEADYAESAGIDLMGPLLMLAVLLLLADFALSFVLRGLMPDWRKLARRLIPVLAAVVLIHPSARAGDTFAMKAALDTRLAYVETGAADTDAMSRAGLSGLGRQLARRTAYEPQEPMGVNLETDDLSFFPLIYWPMEPRQKDLSPKAQVKVAEYMRSGGTFLIDTRDLTLGSDRSAANPGQRTLRRLLGRIDLPPLEAVPPDHVLNRTFYLIHDYPGRWQGGKLWIQAGAPGEGGRGDGVSPVMIGGEDWAGAWAVDGQGRPIADVAPGGDRQREMAIRFGINAAMYALTGNYKTDQIHVPTLLKRLGK